VLTKPKNHSIPLYFSRLVVSFILIPACEKSLCLARSWGLIRKSQAQGRSQTASSSLLSTGLHLVGTCFRRRFWSRKLLLPATLLPFVSLSVLGPVSGRVPSLCTSRASSRGTFFASLPA